jgi:5'-nucleotidase
VLDCKVGGVDLENGVGCLFANRQDGVQEFTQGGGRRERQDLAGSVCCGNATETAQAGIIPALGAQRFSASLRPQSGDPDRAIHELSQSYGNPSRLATGLPDWARVDTVLLDMDGTLLDLNFDNHFWRERVPQRYAELNGLSYEAARQELAPRFAARQGTLEWYCTDFWSRDLGFDVAGMKHEVRDAIRFLPGAAEFLSVLRDAGRRLLLVTNAHHDSLRIKAGQTGLGAYFDQLISSHSFGFPKEHPQFWQALDASGVYEADRALFVDDSLPVLRAARAHGVAQVFAVAQPDSTAPPHIVEDFPAVHSVSELLPGLSIRR